MTRSSDSLDELFCLQTPEEIDTNKTSKYLKDVEYALRSALKVAKYTEDAEAKEAIEEIDSQYVWVEGYLYDLINTYEELLDLLEYYRREVKGRLDEDEKYEFNTILVRNQLEQANK